MILEALLALVILAVEVKAVLGLLCDALWLVRHIVALIAIS